MYTIFDLLDISRNWLLTVLVQSRLLAQGVLKVEFRRWNVQYNHTLMTFFHWMRNWSIIFFYKIPHIPRLCDFRSQVTHGVSDKPLVCKHRKMIISVVHTWYFLHTCIIKKKLYQKHKTRRDCLTQIYKLVVILLALFTST